MLRTECERHRVKILTHCDITQVISDEHYTVISNQGRLAGESLVVATGGLSIPKMGATDFGYRLARQFGLKVRATRAGLVPLTFSGPIGALMARLSGVSLAAVVTTASVAFTERLLFTHRGLSGPAVLQASSYWSPGTTIDVNLLPGIDAGAMLLSAKAERPRALLRTVLCESLPRALVSELEALWWPDAVELSMAQLADARLRVIAEQIHAWRLLPSGTEGYRTAEVTLGGIDTDELSSKTFEAKRQPGLYCIGEVVDVTGHLGGFNFQWAWASAQAAGRVV